MLSLLTLCAISVRIDRLKIFHHILVSSLECQYGLLTDLLSRGVLSEEQVQEIRARRAAYKQNEQLLAFIKLKEGRNLRAFAEALVDSEQGHLVQFVIRPSGQCYSRLGPMLQ
jgi:hypothetical protein